MPIFRVISDHWRARLDQVISVRPSLLTLGLDFKILYPHTQVPSLRSLDPCYHLVQTNLRGFLNKTFTWEDATELVGHLSGSVLLFKVSVKKQLCDGISGTELGQGAPPPSLACFTLLLCKVRGWSFILLACIAESALHTPTFSLHLPPCSSLQSLLCAWSDQFSEEQIGPNSGLSDAFSVVSLMGL